MTVFASEITSSADRSIVLARRVLELDATPDSRGKVCLADEAKSSHFATCCRLDNDTIIDFKFCGLWKICLKFFSACIQIILFTDAKNANLLLAVDMVLAMLAVLGVGDVLRVARSGVTNDLVLVFMGVSDRDGVERVEGSRVKLREFGRRG